MNLSELKKLVKLFENSEMSELELEQEGWRVRLKKGENIHFVPQAQPAPPPAAREPEPAMEAKAEAEPSGHVIKSPMVGTFYRAPSPTSPPFVDEGDTVRKGDVLCIIEAMKLMNEIESDISGKVVRIFPENGKPVEFGEPLFEVEPA
ncbi:MAG: acetyl-CoA carboxylase biotin carboxyl carrier protein [Candidatus Nitrospinota bacterium M3_3B_026]